MTCGMGQMSGRGQIFRVVLGKRLMSWEAGDGVEGIRWWPAAAAAVAVGRVARCMAPVAVSDAPSEAVRRQSRVGIDRASLRCFVVRVRSKMCDPVA